MSRRFAVGFPLVVAALACLSLYRVTLGFPLFYLALLTLMLFWVTQATSWNILSGYSGYFSFGQAAYVGIGAYSTAVLFGRHGVSFYVTILVAACLSALLALAIGAIAFRLRSLRGEIFALLTLAVPFILASLARINSDIDGGQGIIVSVPPFPEGLGLFQDFLYLLNLLVAALAVLVAYLMRQSRFGWALASVRDAEDVAEGLGVPTFRYKMLALLASAVIGGVGGSLFALQIGFVAVDSVFHLTVPLFVIVMSVLGGRTHWFGPVVGVALVVLLQDRLTASGLGEWQLIVLGAILVVLVVLAPEGVYARLRARPLLALGTAVVVTAAVWLPGEPLDAILAGLLAATVVALLPIRRASPPPAPAAEPASPVPAVLSEPPEIGDVLVECRNVARYFGGVRALEDVSLTVREGEIVGLVGPNGSGKTTLVSILSGTLRPTRGSVHIAGNDLAKLPPHRVAHAGVARTYQIPRPFTSMTVRDNVAMAIMFGRSPRSLATARRDAAGPLDVVGLGHLAGAYPDKLNLHQRQLLEIARALAADPKVLLLDEALAGLNPAEIDNAVEVIRRVHRSGVSIVIVEHLLRVVNQLATRVVVLDRGTRLADGDPREVLADPAVVRAYLGKRAHA
ncbi:branched-chain amino acid ABC transporter ATP-binding protein/permease [Phytohabitans sp. LJ34]|uniref:branched-chain amino acid ABC transporter ATP-binding protein/permease n=1 Tax=Phytohabitans sp. LJ34 TaxID=3452217 RepID=UPI003F89FB7C